MVNSLLPNEEAIFFLVHCVYRAMTQEVSCERSPVSGGNSSNIEEELLRNFQILHVDAQQPQLCNPQVNKLLRSTGSSSLKEGESKIKLLER